VEFIFGDHRLDVGRRELRRGAELIAVEPQVFDLLVYLVRNRDRVVSKDDLLATVWGGRIVSESTLTSRINAVRKAVGDSGEAQRLIRTVPRKGIRFVGVVREEQKPAAPVDVPPTVNIARPVLAYGMNAAEVTATPFVAVQAQPGSVRRMELRHALITASLVAVVGIAIAAWWAWPNAGLRPAPRQAGPQNPPAAASTESKPAPRLSIVVLPFENLSKDPDEEYFADGITDDLTSDLSRIAGSFVIARNTAFTYKGIAVDVKQISRELGVRYVLEGSVRRAGDQVQVNVQLIDAESGAHIWTDRCETDRRNLAETQGMITGRLARALNLELMRDAGRRIEEETADPDARDLVMRGWALWYRPRAPAANQEAQRAFERALEIDPRSIDAKIGLARALVTNLVLAACRT
jgi:TolB-like protein/DNA-binding winged helix-turn-helix (wHTH) protein